MAAPKVFVLTIQIHIHKVYCRGARLRPWGPIRLRMLTPHSSAATHSVPPAFPLLFHEGLVFRQVLQCAVDIKVLEEHLKKEVLRLQLTQGPGDILLAQLTTCLSRVLFPKHPLKCLPDGAEMELLMTPTSRFQSAVGPRVEFSTRMVVELCSQDEGLITDIAHGLCLRPDLYIQDENCSCQESKSNIKECPNNVNHHYDFMPSYHHSNEHIKQTSNQVHRDIDEDMFKPHHCNANGAVICDICNAYDRIVRKRFPCSPNPWLKRYLK